MTFTSAGAYDQGKADIKSLSVDDQLGLLWFVYTEMGKSITPAAPGASGAEIAQGLFEQVRRGLILVGCHFDQFAGLSRFDLARRTFDHSFTSD